MLKISFSKIFIAPKDSPGILGGVFRTIFDLVPEWLISSI